MRPPAPPPPELLHPAEHPRFEALVRATAQAVWTADAEGRVVEDSPSWRSYTGQSWEAFRGLGWIDALHPDDRERAQQVWLDAVARGEGYEVEYRLWHHSGVYRWTVARGATVKGPDGEVVEWVGCNWDVDEMKRAQEAADRAAAFHQLMLGVVGHDLRGPLGAIQNAAELIQRGAAPDKLVPRIQRSTRRALAILEGLIDVTQHQLGDGLRLQRSDCDLDAVVNDVLAELEERLAGREVRRTRTGDAVGVWDAARVGQIVANLIGNAVQHGSGDWVSVGVHGDGPQVRLSVSNPAADLPPGLIELLFQPFKRDDAGSTPGLGLGLYIVSQLVDAHGGTLDATHRDGTLEISVGLPR
ncbi:MAG: PAS domain-containing sensor histidine kinase [Myxococcota bacterium]